MAKNFDAGDVNYIITHFRRLATLCNAWNISLKDVRHEIESGVLPTPTYSLGKDLDFVPDDYFVFPGGIRRDDRKTAFINRYVKTCTVGRRPVREADAERAWLEYLSGAAAAYMRVLSPEAMARVICLVARIEAHSHPPDTNGWREELARDVDALDALLRPGISYDRKRGPTLRDDYVSKIRQTLLIPELGEI